MFLLLNRLSDCVRWSGFTKIKSYMAALAARCINQAREPLAFPNLAYPPDKFLTIHTYTFGLFCPAVKVKLCKKRMGSGRFWPSNPCADFELKFIEAKL